MTITSPASAPVEAGQSARTFSWFAGLVIITVALLAYLNTFSVPFLFDDNTSIRENASIRSWKEAWRPPGGGGLTVSGRPLLNLSLALNYAVSGEKVWSYHLLNFLIHTGSGCTLFGVVRRTLKRPVLAARFERDAGWLALTIALLWTVHPLQTEAVTYIAQRAESLAGFIYLLALWCFARASEPGAARMWLLLTWAACLLGMPAKEVMVTAPLMIVLYDRIFVAGTWREVWERRGRFHLALAGTLLVLAGLVLATGNRGGTAGFGTGVSPGAYALTQIGAVVHYLCLAFWPQPLVFDYGTGLANGWGDVWWQAAVLFPLLLASLWAVWRGRPAGFAAIFCFVVLAPSSSFIPIATQTMSEHRMYLPLAGIVVLTVTGLYAVRGRAALVACAMLVPVLASATIRRNHDYRTALALWQDTVDKRPDNARALNSLGAIHLMAAHPDLALPLLEEAVRLQPRFAAALNNLGEDWMLTGHATEAVDCFERTLALKPTDPVVHCNLGNALVEVGRVGEGIDHLQTAIRLDPNLAIARFNLANTLAEHDRPDEAAEQYARLVALTPNDAEARSNYGEVLVRLGHEDEAVEQFEAAVRLNPADAELRNNYGVVLARAGRPVEALPQFEEALRLKPDYPEARENIRRAERALPGRR